ncbi:MAG: hypothetical protein KDD64_16470, partial [Bdellovibrionales bacterium]|nr:hypothetical protein [Bdellovibrionales bacterium]
DPDVKNIFDSIEASIEKQAVVPTEGADGKPLPENAQQFAPPTTLGGKPLEEAITPLHVAGLIAYGFGITDFRIVKRFRDKVVGHKSGGQVRSGHYDIKGDKRREVIKHLRFNEGIPFPAPEELKPEAIDKEVIQRFVRERLENLPKAQREEMSKIYRAHVEAFNTPRHLPACVDSKTIKVRNGAKSAQYYGEKSDDGVLFDALFVKESAPDFREGLTGSDELFGQHTHLHYYESKAEDPIALIASEKGVDCLPFRLRVTEDFIYKDFGENALRNYDEQFAGKSGYAGNGKMHPTVKEKLREFF